MGNVFIRTLILYFFVIVAMRLMGKRQIGDLQPSELVVTIMISDVASVALQSTSIPLLYGIVPVAVLVCMEILLSFISMKNSAVRKVITGTPRLIVKDGIINQHELKKLRMNLDDLFEAIRVNKIKQVEDIKYAFVETNGTISIMPTAASSPLSAKSANAKVKEDEYIPSIIVKDGNVMWDQLENIGRDESWLTRIIESKGFENIKQVFLLTVNGDTSITAVRKERA